MKQNVTKNQEQLESTATQVFNAALPDNNQSGKVSTAVAVDANSVGGEEKKYSLSVAEKNVLQKMQESAPSWLVETIHGNGDRVRCELLIICINEYKKIRSEIGLKNAYIFGSVFLGLYKGGDVITLESVRAKRAAVIAAYKEQKAADEIEAKRAKIEAVAASMGVTIEAIENAVRVGLIKI